MLLPKEARAVRLHEPDEEVVNNSREYAITVEQVNENCFQTSNEVFVKFHKARVNLLTLPTQVDKKFCPM